MTKAKHSRYAKAGAFLFILMIAVLAVFSISARHGSGVVADAWTPPGSHGSVDFGSSGGHTVDNKSGWSQINEPGHYWLNSDCTSKWGVSMDDGATSDIKRSSSEVKIDQGSSRNWRAGLIWLTIPLGTDLTTAINDGKIKMKFSTEISHDTGGGSRSSHPFIAYGSGSQAINSFTTSSGKQATGGSVGSGADYTWSSVEINMQASGISAIRVGVNGYKSGFGRHLDIFLRSMKLEIWYQNSDFTAAPVAFSKVYDGQQIAKSNLDLNWTNSLFKKASPNDKWDWYSNFGYTLEIDSSNNPVGKKNVGSYNYKLVVKYNGSAVDSSNMHPYFQMAQSSAVVKVDITKRSLSVSADAKSKTYGSADPALTYTPQAASGDQGLVSGDTLSGSLSRVAGEDVGSYEIRQNTLTDANNPNYEITFTVSLLTISKKAVSVVIDGKSKVYGDFDPAWTASPSTPSDAWGAATGSWAAIDYSSLSRDAGEDVGSYAIKGDSLAGSNPNYSLSVTNGSLTISKRDVTIAGPDMSKVYWSMAQSSEIYAPSVSYSPSSFDPNNAVSGFAPPSGTLERVAGEDVGTYAITQGTYTNANNPNYNITYQPGSMAITRYAITINAVSGQSKTYGQSDPELAFEISAGSSYPSGAGASGYALLSGSLERVSGENAGSYAISQGTVDDANNPNYQITFQGSVDFEIEPKAITISANDVSVSYDPAKTEADYQAMLSVATPAAGVLEFSDALADLGISLSKANGLNAGTYAITGTASATNYSVAIEDGTFQISKISRTISTASMITEIEYDGSFHQIKGATLSVFDAGAAPAETNDLIDYSGNEFTDVPASGQLDISISMDESVNYLACSATHVVLVRKKALSVQVDDKSTPYLDPIASLTWTISTGSLVSGQTNSVLGISLSTTATASSNAGTYKIEASYSSANYSVSFSGSWSDGVSGTYTISKLQSAVSGSIPEYTYDGTLQTVDGLVLNNSEASISYFNNTFTDVPSGGILLVEYEVAETTNYLGVARTSVNVTICKAQAEIDASGVQTSYVYNGSLQTISSGALHNQTGSQVSPIAYANNSFTDVPAGGTQTVTLSIADNGNYLGTSLDLVVSIAKAPLAFAIDDKSKTYGQADPALTYSLTSGTIFPADQASFSVSLARSQNLKNDVGSYDITCISYSDGNYEATFANGTLTIAPKAVSVTINDSTSAYRAPLQALTYDEAGANAQMEYGETSAALKISLSKGTGDVVGSYPISGGQEADASANYSVSFSGSWSDGIRGTYEITRGTRTIDVSDVPAEYVYDATTQTISGAKFLSEDLDIGESQSVITSSNDTFLDVPSSRQQIVTFSAPQSANYFATSIDVVVSIQPYEVIVDISDFSSVYGEALVSYSSGWALNAETPMPGTESVSILSIALSCPVTATSTVGEYAISGSWDNTKTNYEVSFSGSYAGGLSGTYSITRAETIVSVNVGTYTYDGTQQTVTGFTKNHSEGTLIIDNNVFTDVPNDDGEPGLLKVTYRMHATNNYQAVPVTVVRVIVARATTVIDVSGMQTSFTYDGIRKNVTGATNNHDGNHISSVSYENNTFKDVPASGYLEVIVNSAENNNYEAATETVRVNISKASAALEIASVSAIYGDSEKALSASLKAGSSLQGSDRISDLGLVLERTAGTDAGTYAISCSSYSTPNYDLLIDGGSYVISRKSISIDVHDKTSAYGEAIEALTFALAAGHSMAYSENESVLDVSLAKDAGTYAGTYAIVASQGASASANYAVTFIGSWSDGASGTYTITKISRTIDVSGMDLDRTYDGTTQSIDGAVLSAADPAGDEPLEYSVSSFKDVPASGTIAVTVSIAATTNFEPASVEVVVNVAKLAVTLNVLDVQSEYKDPLATLAAEADAATPLAAGEAISALNLALSCEVVVGSLPGTYEISASYSNGNYDVAFAGSWTGGVSGTYTVTKAHIGVVADAKTVTYGQSASLSYTLSGSLKAGDSESDLAIVLDRGTATDAGEYEISLSSSDQTKYQIAYTQATYTIVPKAIAVAIADKASVYGESLEALTYTVSTSLEYGEAESVLGISLSKAGGINAGQYAISGTATGSGNYAVAFSGSLGTDGEYVISKAASVIDATSIPKSFTYNGTEQSAVGDPALILNQEGDFVDTIQYSNNVFTNVPAGGKLLVTVSVSGNQNYHPDSTSFYIIVSKAATVIDVSGITTEYTYDAARHTIDSGATHNQIGEFVESLSYTGNSFLEVPMNASGNPPYGTQTMTVSVPESTNYLAASVDIELKIYKAQSTIDTTAMETEYTYDGQTHTVEGAILNHVEGSLSYSNNVFTSVPASGIQTITIEAAETRNYQGASVTVAITISKALQIIDVSGIKISYKRTVDTLPVNITSGASVPDSEQTLIYEDNQYSSWSDIENSGLVHIYAQATQNYLFTETYVQLYVDKLIPVIDVSGVVKEYTYTGSLITINSGATLVSGDPAQTLQYSNNTFTTVAEGHGMAVQVSVNPAGSYIGKTETIIITVHKADTIINVDPSKLDFTYNGNQQRVEAASLANNPEGTLRYENNVFTTVAQARALNPKAIVAETANYKAAVADMPITIHKAKTLLDISGVVTSFVYSGSEQTVSGASINHDEIDIVYQGNKFTTVAEGNGRNVVITAPESDNYESASETVAITVAKATFDTSGISFSGAAVDYDGQPHSLSVAGSLPSGLGVGYSQTDLVNAGTYDVTATFEADWANYNAVSDMNATLVINKIEYDFSAISLEDATKVYDGSLQGIEVSGSIPAGLDGSVPEISYSGLISNVGISTITASFLSVSTNYEVPASSLSASLSITARPITVEGRDRYTIDSDSKDAPVELSDLYYSICNVVDGDTVGLTFTASFEDKNAIGRAVVDMSITACDNSNYELPSNPYLVKIDAAIVYPISIQIKWASLSYNGNGQALPVQASIGGKPCDYEVSFVQSGKTLRQAVNAGQYRMLVTVDDEFAGTKTQEADMQIDRADARIELDGSFSYQYGTRLDFSARLVSDFETVDSNNIRIETPGVEGRASIGTHKVVATLENDVNYKDCSVSKEFTVERRRLTVRIMEPSKYHYTGKSQDVVFKANTAEGDDEAVKVSYGAKADNPKGLGVYPVSVQVKDGNYVLERVIGAKNIEIVKAPLTIKVASSTMIIEGREANFEFSYEGLIEGEPLDKMPSIAKKSYPAGTHMVTPSGAYGKNYEITYEPINITVYQEDLHSTVSGDVNITITGVYEPEAVSTIKPVANLDFIGTALGLATVVEQAYRVRIKEGSRVGDSKDISIVYRDGNMGKSIFDVVCFVNEDGTRIKIKGDDLKDGVAMAKFSGSNGYIILYKDYTILLAVGLVAGLGFIIAMIAIFKTRRNSSRRSRVRWS